MKWLENNPLGMLLAGGSAFLVAAGLGLTFLWNGPVDSADYAALGVAPELPALPLAAEELGPLRDYQLINDRPLFNETRRPQVVENNGEIDVADDQPDLELAVADAPEVRLTGVVITPDERVVTLTPKEGGESVIVRQGMPMEGEYVGWKVTDVEPRMVRLESTEGDEVEVELTVHDAMIKEPPKPEPVLAQGEGQDGEVPDAGAEGENMTRAQEIRQRIQERREQLRAEAEQRQSEEGDVQEDKRSAYQDAIQSMMKRNNKDDQEGDSGDE